MDTSKEYIKMCQKAKEIQKLLDKCNYGNQLVFGNTFLLQGYEVNWLKQYGNGKKCEQWVTDYWTSDNPTFYGKNTIWLPRQDQLQEMVKEKDLLNLCDRFDLGLRENIDGIYSYTDYHKTFKSMEKLWLAFVMKEKYNKTWNGEEWKKS